MSNYQALFAPGTRPPLLQLAIPFFESGSWTAPKDGEITLRLMGGGGGGGRGAGRNMNGYATTFGAPGGSGAWGILRRRVQTGQHLQIIIGAGGVSTGQSSGDGGDSFLLIGGQEVARAYGGKGGLDAANGGNTTNTPATAWPQGFDFAQPGHGAPAGGNTPRNGAAPRLDARAFELIAANARVISHPYGSAASSDARVGSAWDDWGGLPLPAFLGGTIATGGTWPTVAPGIGGGASSGNTESTNLAGGPGYGYLIFVGDD